MPCERTENAVRVLAKRVRAADIGTADGRWKATEKQSQKDNDKLFPSVTWPL